MVNYQRRVWFLGLCCLVKLGFPLCSCSMRAFNIGSNVIWKQFSILVAYDMYRSGIVQSWKVASVRLTNHSPLFMDKHSKVFKNLIHFPNLLLDFVNSLLSFINDSLVEGNFIVQQQNLLSVSQNYRDSKGAILHHPRNKDSSRKETCPCQTPTLLKHSRTLVRYSSFRVHN